MTDRDAAVDAVIDAVEACNGREGHFDSSKTYYGALHTPRNCPSVRAAVEQAIADAYMQGWRDRFNEPIDKAELERQRGAR